MKRKILIASFLILFLTCGCCINKKDVLKDLDKKYSNLKSYHLNGKLEILNNEDTYKYDVDVLYKKDNKYKVTLVNQNNNHEQIILKNEDGVYLLTPSLNKSFKFQSNWPYNNSQVYLLESILNDIKNDKEKSLTEKDNNYIYNTSVNYPNNRKLVNQIVTFDKDLIIKSVDVQDENGISYMKMSFDSIDLNTSIDDNSFKVENIIKISEDKKLEENNDNKDSENIDNKSDTSKTTGSIEDIIYPLYIPSGTKLVGQETIKKDDGERVIMTFDGEKSFLLVEETANIYDDLEIIPTLGEPCILSDTVAALTDSSITWSSGNIDYYIVSDVMSTEELLDVARSISAIPTMK